MEKPIINEVFSDNGEHSHWELIAAETGELLWSEDIEESNIRWVGKPLPIEVIPYYTRYQESDKNPFVENKKNLGILKDMICEDYIAHVKIQTDSLSTDCIIEEIIKHLPCYITMNIVTGELYNHNTKKYEGIDGDTIEYTTYINGKKEQVIGTVEGYTDFQIVKTYEYGSVVLTAEEGIKKKIIKNKKWIK